MSEHDYNHGKGDAGKGYQPAPPDPSKTWHQNTEYQTGFNQERQRQEQQRREQNKP